MAINVKFMPKKEVIDKLSKLYPDFRIYYVEAIQHLFALSNELEKGLEMYYARYGFTRSRYLILMVLLHSDDHRMQPSEIAEALNVTRGNMTGLIDQLLKAGFVKKQSDKEDRRQCYIELTDKGEKFLEKIFPNNFKRMAKFMSVVTKGEIESLISISKKLQGALGAFTEED